MVFVKYARDVKVIVLKLSLHGLTLGEITATFVHQVSEDSLSRWLRLYHQTRNVVRDPALYAERGRPLAISRDGAQMILDVLDTDPTLYIDEIQAHLEAMTGVLHPTSTIKAKLRALLKPTKKIAHTVYPA